MAFALTRRRALAGALVTVAALLSTSCSSDDGGGQSSPTEPTPQQVLATAKQRLDATSGLRIALTTTDLPEGVSGILEATGVATKAPAFDGTLKVVLAGVTAEVPVITVDGKTYAQLPLTSGWSEIDLADYGAPDPAGFVSPDSGFSSLLPATTDLTKGATVRGGTNNAEVLTEYRGTVPGEAMKAVIPSAAGDSFAAVYSVADADTPDAELRSAAFTGVFYPDSASMTYTVEFTDYGSTQEITAP